MIEVRLATRSDLPAVAALVQEIHTLHALALPDVFQPPTVTVATRASYARHGFVAFRERLVGRPGWPTSRGERPPDLGL